MNVYTELYELLRPAPDTGAEVLFGTLTHAPTRTVTVEGTAVREGIRWPEGLRVQAEDEGRTLALLSCREGFLALFYLRGGEGPA